MEISDSTTNHELWQAVSLAYLSIFEDYRKLKATKQIPLKWLVFRKTEDFTSGTWAVFKQFWLPFINLMPEPEREDIYNSLFYGVDILPETQLYQGAEL